jgi:hypothetical protein
VNLVVVVSIGWSFVHEPTADNQFCSCSMTAGRHSSGYTVSFPEI